MAGPQFFHIQTYARKLNAAGQSVEQVLAEAGREPKYSQHVASPRPYRIVMGLSPQEVQQRHDEMVAAGGVAVAMQDGKTARRGIRKDRHTLLTVVASHPNLTAQVEADPSVRAEYEAWIERNVRFLRDLFGDQLVSVIEHTDEEHPHLHAYVLPLGDPSCSARDLNPCWTAKSATEASARAAGETDKAAVKLGNDAYRARARQLQDQYHHEVGLASGLTRTGPKRERLSRAQWRARKDEATRNARTIRQMEGMVVELADQEDALISSSEKMARDLEAKLNHAEALYADAEAERAAAIHDRAEMTKALKKEAATLRAAAEEEASRITTSAEKVAEGVLAGAEEMKNKTCREAEVRALRLQRARDAFESEKALIAQNIAKEAAVVALHVIAGVMTGKVGVQANGAGWIVRDDDLRERVAALKLGPALGEIVAAVTGLWDRLKQRLSASDLAREQKNAASLIQAPDLSAPTSRTGRFEP